MSKRTLTYTYIPYIDDNNKAFSWCIKQRWHSRYVIWLEVYGPNAPSRRRKPSQSRIYQLHNNISLLCICCPIYNVIYVFWFKIYIQNQTWWFQMGFMLKLKTTFSNISRSLEICLHQWNWPTEVKTWTSPIVDPFDIWQVNTSSSTFPTQWGCEQK